MHVLEAFLPVMEAFHAVVHAVGAELARQGISDWQFLSLPGAVSVVTCNPNGGGKQRMV